MKKTKHLNSWNTARKRSPSPILFPAWAAYVLLAAGLVFTAFVRVRYLQVPLERDEGEFGYIAQRILQGLSPFEAYNYKLPGTPLVYALFMALFGQNVSAVHLALLCANLGTALFLFFGFRRALGDCWAAVAAVTYSLLSVDFTVLGTAAHATQFVNLFVAAGLFVLSRKQGEAGRGSSIRVGGGRDLSLEKQNVLASLVAGLLFGMSFLMKQPALAFVGFGGVCLFLQHYRKESPDRRKILLHLASYAIGASAPYLAVVFVAIGYHQFHLFWKWTFSYPTLYASSLSAARGWDNFKIIFTEIVHRFPLLWGLAGLGLLVLGLRREPWTPLRAPVLLLLAFAMAAIVPGYYFHHHYFILLLPVASIGVAIALGWLARLAATYTPAGGVLCVAAFLCILGAGIAAQKNFYFRYSTDDYSNALYFRNPFREAVKIADYIKSVSAEKDKLLVFGSEAEIYFYSKRSPACGYLFVHGLVADQPNNLEMQDEYIAETERNSPEVVVLCGVQYSWLYQPGAPDKILRWFQRYVESGYEIAGMVDMLDQGTVYRWGKEATGYTPQAGNYLVIYKKRVASAPDGLGR